MADRLLDSVDGTSPEELIANSDCALYATKRKGKDRHSFFEKNEKA